MSLDSEFGDTYSTESIEKFGRRMLNKYSELACEEAGRLDDTNLSQGSLGSYKPQVRQIIDEVGESDPTIEDALEVISESDKEGSTKGVMVSAMKKYYEAVGQREKAGKFQEEAKRSDIDSATFSNSMDIKGWLTEDEVNQIIDSILPDMSDGKRQVGSGADVWVFNLEHRAMFETLYYTGCRVSEVAMLKREDLNLDSNTVKVYRLKKEGDKPKRDMVAVPEDYCDNMITFLDSDYYSEGQTVFGCTDRTIQSRIREISDAYIFTFGGFEHSDKLTPHKLRHARVTAIANNSGLDKAGEFVDHSSVDTTKAYRHLATEDQRDILPESSTDSVDDTVMKFIKSNGFDSIDDYVDSLTDSDDMTDSEAKEIIRRLVE